jgi:methionyl-tRNA formyltransferase
MPELRLNELSLVFCGTPPFAVPTLQKLVESGANIKLVITQPDRPSGRGMALNASAVKNCALQLGLPVTQPERIKNNLDLQKQLLAIGPQAIIVVGYGRIIPQWMIALPPLGNLNLHASLLPKYRGAAPIQWAIASGETTTGVTTMQIDAGLDTGDILLQQEVSIDATDTAQTLSPRLAAAGSSLMLKTLQGLRSGEIRPSPQDHTRASLAPILKKEDGQIDFQRSAAEICNRLRAFRPWPGAYTRFRGKSLQVWSAHAATGGYAPGELVVCEEELLVGCGYNSRLHIEEVQLEGKKRMPARDFIHGYQLKAGERLG